MKKPSGYVLEADVLRIFAGFCVVLIHGTDRFLLQPAIVGGFSWWLLDALNVLGKVAVPFFIMLSGFLLLSKGKQVSVRDFYKTRLKRIGIPFLCWVIIYFWWMAFWGKYSVTPMFVLKSLFTGSLLHLYFLPLIAGLYMITPLIWKYISPLSICRQYLIMIMFFFFGIAFTQIGFIYPALNIEHNLFTIFIPYTGYFLAGSLISSISLTKKQTLISLIFAAISFFITILLRKSDINSPIVAYLNPTIILFSLSMFLVLKKIFAKLPHTLNATIRWWIHFISSTILGVFLIHIIVIDLLEVFPIFDPYKVRSPIWLFALLFVFAGFSISFFVVALIKKLPYLSATVG